MRSFFKRHTGPGLRVLSLALVAATAYASSAICTPGTEFNVTGVFSDLATLSGTIDINTTTGCIAGGDLIVTPPPVIADPEFNDLSFGQGYSGTRDSYDATFTSSDSSAAGQSLFMALDLTGNGNTLVGYDGGLLCTGGSTSCGGDAGTVWNDDPVGLTSGDVTPSAPEPSTFVLLLSAPALMAARRLRKIKQ